jgi:hypothetical protein
MESFDLQTFLNGAMMIAVSVLFLMLAFRLLLPVSSSRRLFRLMAATVSGLRSALRDRNPSLSEPAQLSLTFDRLSLALLFVVKPYPARPATIRRIYAFSELDTAVRRAWSGLRAVEREDPAFAPIVAEARQHLAHANAPAMEALARQMFVQCGAGETVWRAAANLYQASLLLLNQTHALHRYGVLR